MLGEKPNMKAHSIEEIEAMFCAMGVGTEADRQRFIPKPEVEKTDSPQIFIRVDAWTEQEGETLCA